MLRNIFEREIIDLMVQQEEILLYEFPELCKKDIENFKNSFYILTEKTINMFQKNIEKVNNIFSLLMGTSIELTFERPEESTTSNATSKNDNKIIVKFFKDYESVMIEDYINSVKDKGRDIKSISISSDSLNSGYVLIIV